MIIRAASIQFQHIPGDRQANPALGAAQGVPVATPKFGEALPLLRPHAGSAWWRTVGKSTGAQ